MIAGRIALVGLGSEISGSVEGAIMSEAPRHDMGNGIGIKVANAATMTGEAGAVNHNKLWMERRRWQ
jgi:hypothetical protein